MAVGPQGKRTVVGYCTWQPNTPGTCGPQTITYKVSCPLYVGYQVTHVAQALEQMSS